MSSDFSHRAPLLGAHLSTAGSLSRALHRAAEIGAESLQIFVRPPSTWNARSLPEDECEAFRERKSRVGMPVLAHAIYLVNLAAPEGDVRRRSIDTLVEERLRCSRLDLDGLVVHMGAHLGHGVDAGLDRLVAALREVLERSAGARTPILLENSAGQGSCLGAPLEHLARACEAVDAPSDLGACLDTCHAFAAGYDLAGPDGYEAFWQEVETILGRHRVRAFHVNDSKKGLGCRVDRHEHIGLGCIGESGFRRLVQDCRVQGLPLVLETPDMDKGMDEVNLQRLRAMREEARPGLEQGSEEPPGCDAVYRRSSDVDPMGNHALVG